MTDWKHFNEQKCINYQYRWMDDDLPVDTIKKKVHNELIINIEKIPKFSRIGYQIY